MDIVDLIWISYWYTST